jgi:hypothetical protein
MTAAATHQLTGISGVTKPLPETPARQGMVEVKGDRNTLTPFCLAHAGAGASTCAKRGSAAPMTGGKDATRIGAGLHFSALGGENDHFPTHNQGFRLFRLRRSDRGDGSGDAHLAAISADDLCPDGTRSARFFSHFPSTWTSLPNLPSRQRRSITSSSRANKRSSTTRSKTASCL